MTIEQTFDVAVIGAGVFGSWTAYQLRRAGAAVVLVDAYGAGNSRASSGGESRIIRMGYGPDEIYTRMAQNSLALWEELFDRVGPGSDATRLFQRTGVLWLAHQDDAYCEALLEVFARCGVRSERLDQAEISHRYSQISTDSIAWGILEPDSGVLMARRAVQALVAGAQDAGVVYREDAALTPLPASNARLAQVETTSGNRLCADKFVFACGPWLPKLFPDLLSELIHVTRQEVFFFGVPAGDSHFSPGHLPAWIDFHDLVYGIPNLDKRGFKIAIDAHGARFDPDSGDRVVSRKSIEAVRSYLARRVPLLAGAPVTETRVCQYENTSSGDFLIDRHPAFENVWFVGGGSGHGFKHGPAVGAHVTALISGTAQREPRFSLATKGKVQHRQVY